MNNGNPSDFQKRFVIGEANALYTREDLEKAVTEYSTQVMEIAIQASRQAVIMERNACAKVVADLAALEEEGELCTALKDAAKAILERIPSQIQ